MNIAETEALLQELSEQFGWAHVDVGIAGRPPYLYAYVTLTSRSDAEQYAKVSSPGVGWYQLDVAGGLYTGLTDDLASDEEVREYLGELLSAAVAYLEGRWSTGTSRILRRPFVIIHSGEKNVKLSR